MTSRAGLEGTLARWFALDADSHLGVFTGSYAAWPSAVFEDYLTVGAADDFLSSAPAEAQGTSSANRTSAETFAIDGAESLLTRNGSNLSSRGADSK
jgi:hypothetical protein